MADNLERIGPTYVKLSQLLSTRPDLVPPTYIDALTRLRGPLERSRRGHGAHRARGVGVPVPVPQRVDRLRRALVDYLTGVPGAGDAVPAELAAAH